MKSGMIELRRLNSKAAKLRGQRRRFSMESLEERCVLTGFAASFDSSQFAAWFSAGSAAETSVAIDSTATSQWMVQLTTDATALAQNVPGAEKLLGTITREFQVVRGLGMPGQVLIATSLPANDVESSLSTSPLVQSFELNRNVNAQLLPNDPQFTSGAQHGFENDGTHGTADADIDAAAAWDLTTGDRSLVVGVIDSGLALDHPDLFENVWIHQGEISSALRAELQDTDGDSIITFRDLNQAVNAPFASDLNLNGYVDAYDLLADARWADGIDNEANGFVDDLFGWDFVGGDTSPATGGDNDPTDEHGHGTHVAGTIAATGNNGIGVTGITWSTSIMPLRFLDENRSGQLSDAIAAINYATMMRSQFGVDMPVTNNSWGYRGEESELLRAALTANAAADMLFVAAAGNGDALGLGIDNDEDSRFAFFPASDDREHIVSVAATDSRDRLARFSNYGAASVDIAAPGVGIVSTDPLDQGNGGYTIRSGTSMAAPLVSGVAALVWSLNPSATVAEVKAALVDAAAIDSLAELSGSVASGGRLNAFGALTVDRITPRANAGAIPNVDGPGVTEITFSVVYTDNRSLDAGTVSGDEIIVTDRFDGSTLTNVTLVNSAVSLDGKQIEALYRLTPPGGGFEDGDYEVALRGSHVFDTQGNAAVPQVLGTFNADTTPNLFRASEVTDDGSIDSLRGAIGQAAALSVAATIRLTAGTYQLSIGGADEDSNASGDLDLSGTLTIKGAGADRTTIDANSLDRVFHVLPGAVIELRDLSIVGGLADDGGGIRINAGGMLRLTRVMLFDNQAARGGGIFNAGSLEVFQSTVHHNGANSSGGGLFNDSAATATLENATISTNGAADGGGIFNSGSLSVNAVTIAENQADMAGGGLMISSGTVSAINTIVAENFAAASGADIDGQVASLGTNLVGVTAGNSGWVASDLLDVASHLGPLQFNGGNVDTAAVWTHVPQANSPAIDAGNNAAAPANDQRGIPRPLDANGDLIATVDIGAVERYFGSVAGVRFLDENQNGIHDEGESPLASLVVYVDLNRNEQLDSGEPMAVTEADGSYQFGGLAPGRYFVVDLPQQGWRQIRADFGSELDIVSQGSQLLQANGHSSAPAISADGRFVVFSSQASNLVDNDINFASDVFLHDRLTGQLELISVSADGLPGNGDSYHPTISADGSTIIFETTASNLDPLGVDTNPTPDIYAYDRTTGILALLSGGNGASANPAVSADGRFVAFDSLASDLVAGDTNQSRDVFVVDRQSGSIDRVSVTTSGAQANFHSTHPAISGNGQVIVFESQAQNLDSSGLDIDSSNDIYVHDRTTGLTELISFGIEQATPSDPIVEVEADNPSSSPSISSDGQVIAFRSFATNLVLDDTNLVSDVFVHHRATRSTQLVSLGFDNSAANGDSDEPAISGDGRFVAFRSEADLVAEDTNSVADVYLVDLDQNSIARTSVDRLGNEVNGASMLPAVSADGSYVALVSEATNLVEGDTNARSDIFVVDRQTSNVERLNTTTVGVNADGPSGGGGLSEPAAISDDGRFVAFSSFATNLVEGDTNGKSDIFVRDRQTGAVELISVGLGGAPADLNSRRPSISADGRFVAFESQATNLVANDLNAESDIFLFDRLLNTIEIISNGQPSDGSSYRPAISANGYVIAFESEATNLDPLGIDTDTDLDVFVYDRLTGTIELVSRGAERSGSNGESHSAQIAADGSLVVFTSTASNLAADSVDLNATSDVYLFDRSTQATQLISAGIGGSVGIGTVLYSADMATDPGWTLDGGSGAWEYGTPQGALEDPSSGFTGTNVVGFNLAGGYPPGLSRSYATTPAIDVAGHDNLVLRFARHLAVEPPLFSQAGIEVSSDNGPWLPVWQNTNFVTDLDWQLVTYDLPVEQASTIQVRWYLDSAGDAFELGGWNIDDVIVGSAVLTPAAASGASHSPAISADGHFVAYISDADNLVPLDPTAGQADVYRYDRHAGAVQRIAATVDPTQSGFGEGLSLSADGQYLAFASSASDLVADDTNRVQDVFVYDHRSGGIERVSEAAGAQGNELSGRPAICGDGRYVTFRSEASNFVSGDLNFAADLFVAPTSALALRGVPVAFAAGATASGIDLGSKPGAGAIRGQLFHDDNLDGTRQASEGALIGWTVYLDSNQNATLDPGEAFRVTNSFGEYEFAGLQPLQSYHLRAVAEPFWVQSTPRQTDGGAHHVMLAAGALVDGIAFGFDFHGPGGQSLNEISGVYFLDTNRNGVRDTAEPPIPGGVVFIDTNGNGVLDNDEPSQTTDASGNYHFVGMPVGSYTIRIVGSSEFVRTQPLNNALPPQLIAGSLETTNGLAVGDFNGDSFDDIVVASGDGVFVQLNNQSGGFGQPIRTIAGVGAAGAYTVVAARFNDDALLDLAFTNRLTNNVTVMLGNGDGTFTHSANYLVGTWPHGLAAGDFNRDGRTDLAVGTEAFGTTRGTVQIMWNATANDGTFRAPEVIHSVAATNVFSLQALQLTDDNLDGLVNASDAIDLVIANNDRLATGNDIIPGNVTLLYNGAGGFSTSIALPAGNGPVAVTGSDFDGDGDLDLAVANFTSDSVSIYQNVGNGSMVKLPGEIAAGSGPFAVTSSDVDGDGDPDLVVAGSAGSRLLVLRNVTNDADQPTFSSAETYGSGAFPRAVSSSVAAADFDRDGFPDLAIAYNDDGLQIENRTGNVEVYFNAVFPGGYEVLLNGLSPSPKLEFGVAPAAASSVVDRHVFYNNSVWDGHDPSAGVADDAAIATDKEPLLQGGGQASFVNYTSYSRGINGVMIDIAGLPAGVTLDPAEDFAFRIGNNDQLNTWQGLTQLPTVAIRRGAGTDGSARVTLTWPDHSIVGTWLEITVAATARTGLASPDLFYIGNAPGDTGNSAEHTLADALDYAAIRANPKLSLAQSEIDDRYDLNRDGLVNAGDLLLVREHARNVANSLTLITLSGSVLMSGKSTTEGESAIGSDTEVVLLSGFDPSVLSVSHSEDGAKKLALSAAEEQADDESVDRLMASIGNGSVGLEYRDQTVEESNCLRLEDALDTAFDEPGFAEFEVEEFDWVTMPLLTELKLS